MTRDRRKCEIWPCICTVLAVMCLCRVRGRGRCVGGEIGVRGASRSSLHLWASGLGPSGAADPFY